ncbi:MAG TPA: hypothetical protein VJ508_01755 [Saprospiraceae bacterium]|nr:hypothetical protein [Saprospiraceae bacterium]
MIKLERLSNKVKVILASGAILVSLAGVITTGKAFAEMPARLAEHDSITNAHEKQQVELLRTQVCIQIADHRKADWTHCLTKGIDP